MMTLIHSNSSRMQNDNVIQQKISIHLYLREKRENQPFDPIIDDRSEVFAGY